MWPMILGAALAGVYFLAYGLDPAGLPRSARKKARKRRRREHRRDAKRERGRHDYYSKVTEGIRLGDLLAETLRTEKERNAQPRD